ncbi:HEAT repeat-containing protein 4 isoform X2 [Sorex araneus]|nr:HEAT repeat-containing protein 4 isoform X2 [Sorex araneus]XP_054989167.1 HEAT repeat-containing protein 4 isoform X2 [Sorex araneus]XP_054989168.1 HEAT repeat-containing protein 4 isoform X2 [Sorex araneus]XP_054989169.1 HEAT repeat-containing protein 4 isoform X2 [Sorex araneus]
MQQAMTNPHQKTTVFSHRYPRWLHPRLKWGMSFHGRPPQTVAGSTAVPPAPPVVQFSPRHNEHLRERYLQQAAAELTFAPDVVAQRGLASVPYLECRFEHLYQAHPFHVAPPPRATTRPSRSPGLGTPEHPAVEGTSARRTVPALRTQRVARYYNRLQRKARPEVVPPPRPPDNSPSLGSTLRRQDFEDPSLEQQESWMAPPDGSTKFWEALVLEKLNKRTARWILSKHPQKGGVPPSKWQGFLRHQYDWSHIRDELTSESQLRLLEQLEKEEMAEFETPPSSPPVVEEKEPEMTLFMYYRLPKYLSEEQKDEIFENKTTDEINQRRGTLHFSDQSYYLPVTRRAGKFSFATDNAFEQEIYLDKVKIIHPIGAKRSQILLENHNLYNKQLCEIFPRPPERWTSESVPEAPCKPVKGARRWTGLPIRVKELLESGEADALIKPKCLQNMCQLLKEHLSWKREIMRKVLQQWITDWALIIEWRHETIKSLLRRLADLHSSVRVQAIITCAVAALERPRNDTCQQHPARKETKASCLQDLPEVLYPALEATLSDKNVNVQIAAALCQCAIRSHNPLAQDIMQTAVLKGNSVNSWAAAQCLALEGVATYPVIKRILYQLFNKKDKNTEQHSCLLLRYLNKQTTLINTMLAVELNSGDWRDRVVACRVLAQINRDVSLDIKHKFIQLMWSDWNKEVRQTAAHALGQMNLGKEVHDAIRVKLSQGTPQDRVKALNLIGRLKLMTAKLLPHFLNCFSDEYVAVRQAACVAAGALQIHDQMVRTCLLNLIERDPYWKVKALAIQAMVKIGQVSPQLTDLLLWAMHYESPPGVRLEACRSILALQIQGNEVRDTFLHVLLLEEHDAVVKEIHKAMKMFKLENDENQEMIQNIKNRIQALSQKDLLTQNIVKIEAAIKKVKEEAKRVYFPPKADQEPQKFQTFLQNTFQGEVLFPRRSTETTCNIEAVIKSMKPREPNPWLQSQFLNPNARGRNCSTLVKNLHTGREKRLEAEPLLFDNQILQNKKTSKTYPSNVTSFLQKKIVDK